MLKKFLLLTLLILTATPVFARSNAEIGHELYGIADEIGKMSISKSDKMKDNIAVFLSEANWLNFNEDTAVWKKLPNGWLYDAKSLWNLYNRHIGVYKSPDGLVMGIFDLNCEDYNDLQERQFGYVNKTEVYFSTNYRPQRGRSTGIYQTFCK